MSKKFVDFLEKIENSQEILDFLGKIGKFWKTIRSDISGVKNHIHGICTRLPREPNWTPT